MRITILATLVLIAACSSSMPPLQPGDDDPFHVAATRPAVVPEPADVPPDGTQDVVRFRVIRSDTGAIVSEPRLIVMPGQPASITVGGSVAYVETFTTVARPGAWIADPVIGKVDTGLRLEVVSGRAEDGRVPLAYRLGIDELTTPVETRNVGFRPDGQPGTIHLPRVDTTEILGVLCLEPGRMTRIARMPSPDGSVGLDVLASIDPGPKRETASRPDGEAVVAASSPLLDLLGEPRSGGLRFGVTAVTIPADLEVGREIDGRGVDAYLTRGKVLRFGEIVTSRRPGSRLSVLRSRRYVRDYEEGRRIEEPGVNLPVPKAYQPIVDDMVTGLVAELTEGNRVRIRWTTGARPRSTFTTRLANGTRVSIDLPEVTVHERETTLPEGRRLLPLARLENGGTLAVLVEGKER